VNLGSVHIAEPVAKILDTRARGDQFASHDDVKIIITGTTRTADAVGVGGLHIRNGGFRKRIQIGDLHRGFVGNAASDKHTLTPVVVTRGVSTRG
jgi:hypothetical protein